MTKTVTIFSATGSVGRACIDELIRLGNVNIRILARAGNQQEKATAGILKSPEAKQALYDGWKRAGAEIRPVNATEEASLIPALRGTDYLISCVPYNATESQYPLIGAAKEAGVERFVPSEFGFIYEWEQFSPTETSHRRMARQKVFIRRVIEAAGLDFTIIPAGLWPEYYMVEPVVVHGDGAQKISWSTGADVGRILPHVLFHPNSRNAICPVAATAYCSWNELLDVRQRLRGRPVERVYFDNEQFKAAYALPHSDVEGTLLSIGVAATECPVGISLCANWNAKYNPECKGPPLEELFPNYIEPFAEAVRKMLMPA